VLWAGALLVLDNSVTKSNPVAGKD